MHVDSNRFVTGTGSVAPKGRPGSPIACKPIVRLPSGARRIKLLLQRWAPAVPLLFLVDRTPDYLSTQLLRKTAVHVPGPELCAHQLPATEYVPETEEKVLFTVPVNVPLAFGVTRSSTNEVPFRPPLTVVLPLHRLDVIVPETVLPDCCKLRAATT